MDCTIFRTVLSLVIGLCFSSSLAYSQHTIPAQTAHACCNNIAQPSAKRGRFFSRTLPNGDLHQRYPYETFKFYYYNRPYSSFNTSSSQPGTPNAIPSQNLYSREIFRQVYQDAEQQILDSRFLDSRFLDYYAESGGTRGNSPTENPDEQVARDKNFEFVDWLGHYRARHEWERQQAERQQAERQQAERQQAERQKAERQQAVDDLRMESPIEFKAVKPASFPKPRP